VRTQSEVATDRLREQIIRGEHKPGSHVQEQTLSDALGVSRTPVRTALNTLANEGLLEYVAKRGYRVREFSLREIGDAYEVRATLEGMGCRLVAERGLGRASERRLRCIVEQMEKIIEDGSNSDFDRDRWRELNHRFHIGILDAAGNDLLKRLITETARLPLATLRTIADWGARETVVSVWRSHIDHFFILDALARGQAFRAEARMREHIQVGGQMVHDQYTAAQELDPVAIVR
jgi:GntR family transcriptional regulator of vanillate catabolism